MEDPAELDARALKLEEEADDLEQAGRNAAAQGRLQQAKSLRDQATLQRQMQGAQAPGTAGAAGLQQTLGIAAQPADAELQTFWQELAAVRELSLSGTHSFLVLSAAARFPLEGSSVQRRLYIRQCYLELMDSLDAHFASGGRSFIITGNPGIGKSLFVYFLMWRLAHSNQTVVWDRRDRDPIMFCDKGIFEGPLTALKDALRDPQTWYVVDGHAPKILKAKTVLVTSPDYNIWKEAAKQPGSLVRFMPVWSWPEVQAAREHIFSQQAEADVQARFRLWGGIPRYVLQLLDATHQGLLTEAINTCSLGDLLASMTDLNSAVELSHRLIHLTVTSGCNKGPAQFASQWVGDQLISRYLQYRSRDLLDFLTASGGEPAVAAFRGRLWERHAHDTLYRGGTFSCRDLTKAPRDVFEHDLLHCSSQKGLWNLTDIRTELDDGVYGFGKNKIFPAVDAVVQPDCLFQITVSEDHRIDVQGLVSAVQAMRADTADVKLFFAVPPNRFAAYPKQSLKRIRGDIEAARAARSVKQYVLRIDLP